MLQQLSDSPVLGVNMGNLAVLRLDQSGGLAPGNKHFKLLGNISQARRLGVRRLVSFGGSWSNHLHALAALGADLGYATVGVVRGDDDMPETAMLVDARAWGMDIVKVSRSEYRRRFEPAYLDAIQRRFAPCLLIPEGGGNPEGVRACIAIAGLVVKWAPAIRQLVLPVGTGTTLAGLLAGLDSDYTVTGVSALKGARDLERRVVQALENIDVAPRPRWQILHGDHCGGFARVSDGLREFMLEFERQQGIALDPVYTGKMFYAIHRRLLSGECPADVAVLALHTGGLQGRRGYDWLQQ